MSGTQSLTHATWAPDDILYIDKFGDCDVELEFEKTNGALKLKISENAGPWMDVPRTWPGADQVAVAYLNIVPLIQVEFSVASRLTRHAGHVADGAVAAALNFQAAALVEQVTVVGDAEVASGSAAPAAEVASGSTAPETEVTAAEVASGNTADEDPDVVILSYPGETGPRSVRRRLQ